MENLEEMAQLAVRQGFLDIRMKELKARLARRLRSRGNGGWQESQ
jgi:hypothetical protein